MPTYLVAGQQFMDALPERTRVRFRCVTAESLYPGRWAEIESALAEGASIVAVGNTVLPRLRPLWLDSYAFTSARVEQPAWQPLPLPRLAWRDAACRGLFVRPDKFNVYFGHDEMPRAEFVPLLEAADSSGNAGAYPAVWIKHVAASLVRRRFTGSNWYVFAFDNPLDALAVEDWSRLLDALCDHAANTLAIVDARAHYSCHREGENVLVNIRLANRGPDIAAARLELSATPEAGGQGTRRWIRRVLNGHEEVVVPWEIPACGPPGLWKVETALYHEDRLVYGAARAATARLVERAECAYVVASAHTADLAKPEIRGRSLKVDGKDGFLAGTHYYPSSSWYDWVWRDFRPEKAARDIAAMARLGYSFARVWIDPELDEQALRGFEAWLHLSGAA